ncbi:methionyl-tRNA formyltransferase [Candidatus Saccharibacteria bacterium]|nr:methionyl-tRNA formyltransferase [Candidatus Saccharibacteria bacterium]
MATRIVFFGNERLATGVTTTAPTLTALINAGYEVAAVVASHHDANSRTKRELEIETVASQHHIPVLLPNRPADIAEQLNDLGAEIGVLVAYGRIIPQRIIDIFPRGIINIHPSLLPKHRGSIPVESVIREGDTHTGVSIMQLVTKMDAGPVWAQSKFELSGNESKSQLATRLQADGAGLLLATLPAILNGHARPKPQDEAEVTTDERITKADGQLDFSKSAARLEREIRAYLGWPGSYTQIAGRDVIITAAHVEDGTVMNQGEVRHDKHSLCIGTSDGVLGIDSLKPAGKREMTSAEFVLGLR